MARVLSALYPHLKNFLNEMNINGEVKMTISQTKEWSDFNLERYYKLIFNRVEIARVTENLFITAVDQLIVLCG